MRYFINASIAFWMLFGYLLIASPQKTSKNTVKILTWQEYISPEVRQEMLKDYGFLLEETTYLTNEMAISRLLSNKDGFEVAIISNLAYEVIFKNQSYLRGIFSNVKRNYFPMFKSVKNDCLPFSWLVSGYMYDPNKVKLAPNTIDDLLQLLGNNIHIGFVDDPVEVAQRIMADRGQNIDVLFEYPPNRWKGAKFLVDIPNVFPKDSLAVFTWHGIAADYLLKNRSLNFELPKKNILIGFDLVCIVSKDKAKISVLKKFVEKLTSQKTLERNIQYGQYFSPYMNARQKELDPKIRDIFDRSMHMIKNNDFTFTKNIDERSFDRFSKWWRSVRYEQ